MAIIDSHPHPRVLFVGWEEDDPDLQEMTALVATSLVWDGALSTLRWEDWDAVVSRSAFEYASSGHEVEVLALGMETLPWVMDVYGGGAVRCGNHTQVSPEFETNDDLPDGLRRLVRDDLAPWLRDQDERPLMTISSQIGPTRLTSANGGGASWFVRDPDGTLIAGAYVCRRGGRVWCIPYVPKNPARWLAVALRQWHESRPEVFPDRDPWNERPQWMSLDELNARVRIEEAECELEQLITAGRALIEARRDDLRSAQLAADSGVRRLVASQGDDELTESVFQALTNLGFTVEKRDNVTPRGMAKQEDLRVTPPGGKTGIAEVKGYARGAKQSDLLKITKYAAVFERETGQPPERQWYVCNQFLTTDPDNRPEILPGADDDLAEFAADGGAVIDTRELFKLVRSVEDGHFTSKEARASLWSSPARYVAPARLSEAKPCEGI